MKRFRGTWNGHTVYWHGDGVFWEGRYFYARYPTTGRAPSAFPQYWQVTDPPFNLPDNCPQKTIGE